MFAIRFTGGMTSEAVYSCYAYHVERPAECNKAHPVITMSISPSEDPHPYRNGPGTLSITVTEMAFVMNETGKTIDKISSEYVDESIEGPSVFKTSSEALAAG